LSDSLSEWLALREPADIAARSAALTQLIADVLPDGPLLRILDLGSGTGSNVRYLSPRLPRPQEWLLVDRDRDLLSEVPGGTDVCRIETISRDLGRLEDEEIFRARELVTASALLDLVSPRWLDTLAAHCRAGGAAVLFALTYNGQSRCSPVDSEDEIVRELMNRHQRRDKGLGGPAAGPAGVECAERSFAAAGYQVRRAASDWILSADQRELQRQLIQGWAHAAVETAPERESMIQAWLARRRSHIEAGTSTVIVGHEDLAAWKRGRESFSKRRKPRDDRRKT
jgi:hypothetical protein